MLNLSSTEDGAAVEAEALDDMARVQEPASAPPEGPAAAQARAQGHMETGKPMDLVAEMGDLHMRLIFVSAFGLTDLH